MLIGLRADLMLICTDLLRSGKYVFRVTEWERSGGIEPVDDYFCATGRLTAGIETAKDFWRNQSEKKTNSRDRTRAVLSSFANTIVYLPLHHILMSMWCSGK